MTITRQLGHKQWVETTSGGVEQLDNGLGVKQRNFKVGEMSMLQDQPEGTSGEGGRERMECMQDSSPGPVSKSCAEL